MTDKILETFERYADEDPELAISITARELNIAESTVRFAINA